MLYMGTCGLASVGGKIGLVFSFFLSHRRHPPSEEFGFANIILTVFSTFPPSIGDENDADCIMCLHSYDVLQLLLVKEAKTSARQVMDLFGYSMFLILFPESQDSVPAYQ